MDNPEEIWNLLHDGSIAGVSGHVPGDLTLRIEIDYLTRIMAPPCQAIDVTLVDCESFEYLNWNDDRRNSDVNILAERETEILSATCSSAGVRVICSDGQFDIKYEGIRMFRADGQATSIKEIDAAAKTYWDAFGAKNGG